MVGKSLGKCVCVCVCLCMSTELKECGVQDVPVTVGLIGSQKALLCFIYFSRISNQVGEGFVSPQYRSDYLFCSYLIR